MKLGAIHALLPAAVQPLSTRAALHRMAIPQRADWWAKCPADNDALGNDTKGSCVPCADLRIIQSRRANAHGDTWKPTKDDADPLYTLRTGYDPATGQPDIGTDTVADMTAWATTGIRLDAQNEDIIRWATVELDRDDEIAIAIAHLGPQPLTLNLPIAFQDYSNWSVAPGNTADWQPGSWGMHRVAVGAFDGRQRVCRTWGLDLILHPDSWLKYGVRNDICVSRNWIDTTGLSPAGLDWDALVADVEAIV
jgi:hypothetical protein